ncbi:hypothetical protein H8E52_03305 [bacterium]|nr:hypothetical protein [bacterium]
MKKLIVLCLPILLIPFLSCSQSTEPEDNPDPPDDDFTILAETDIGPAGGTLSGGGFEMTIPAGAFETSVSLELAISQEESLPDEYTVTPIFRVDGLPEVIHEDLQIAMAYEGTLSGESFIAEGLYVYGEVEGAGLQMHIATLETVESGGRLIADALPMGRVPASPGPRNDDAMRMIRFFLGQTRFVKSSSDFFEFTYYELYESDVAILALLLESELAVMMEDWNLTFGANEYRFPIRVHIRDSVLDSDNDWLLNSGTGFLNPGTAVSAIFVSPGWIAPEMHIRLPELSGAILLRVYETMCEGRLEEFIDPTQLVIHEAFCEWAKGEFTIDPSFVRPPSLNGRERKVLNGLVAGMGDPPGVLKAEIHGQDISPYAKFLMDHPSFGIDGYKSAYEAVRSGTPILDAIKNSGAAQSLLFPEFIESYFEGDIYEVDNALLTADPIATWVPSTISTSFMLNDGDPTVFPDLSAKVIAINLDSSYEDDATIRMEIESHDVSSDDLAILLFVRENDHLIELGMGYNSDWTFDGIHDLASAGYTELFAVAVNMSHDFDYLGEADVYVELTLEQTHTFLLDPSLTFDCWYWYDEQLPPAHWPSYTITLPAAHGALGSENSELLVNWKDMFGPNDYIHYTGTYTVTVNEDLTVLESFVANLTRCYIIGGEQVGNGTIYVDIDGPWTTDSPGVFGAWGLDVCNYLLDISYHVWHDIAGEEYLTGWGCNDGSYMGMLIY